MAIIFKIFMLILRLLMIMTMMVLMNVVGMMMMMMTMTMMMMMVLKKTTTLIQELSSRITKTCLQHSIVQGIGLLIVLHTGTYIAIVEMLSRIQC